MAITCDCAEGRHEVCRGAGPNYYCPQTAHMGDQPCACGCHRDPCPMGCGGKTEDPYGGPCKACWASTGSGDRG